MKAESAQSPKNSLDRAFLILDLVSHARFGLTNAEIGRKIGAPSSSCTYVLKHLEQRGYVARDGRGRYRLGLNPLVLAHRSLRGMTLRSAASPILAWLVRETGMSACLATRQEGRVVIIDRIESPKLVEDAPVTPKNRAGLRYGKRDLSDIGRHLPLHSNALGKAILSFLPTGEALKLIESDHLRKFTRWTITSREDLLHEMEAIKGRGYSISREEHDAGISSLAAPIFESTKVVRSAVSIAAPSEDLRENSIGLYAKIVCSAARAISEQASLS